MKYTNTLLLLTLAAFTSAIPTPIGNPSDLLSTASLQERGGVNTRANLGNSGLEQKRGIDARGGTGANPVSYGGNRKQSSSSPAWKDDSSSSWDSHPPEAKRGVVGPSWGGGGRHSSGWGPDEKRDLEVRGGGPNPAAYGGNRHQGGGSSGEWKDGGSPGSSWGGHGGHGGPPDERRDLEVRGGPNPAAYGGNRHQGGGSSGEWKDGGSPGSSWGGHGGHGGPPEERRDLEVRGGTGANPAAYGGDRNNGDNGWDNKDGGPVKRRGINAASGAFGPGNRANQGNGEGESEGDGEGSSTAPTTTTGGAQPATSSAAADGGAQEQGVAGSS